MGIGKKAGNFERNKAANFIVVPLKKGTVARNAEEILLKLIGPHKLNRKNYGSLVSHTCYQGEFLIDPK